MPQLAMADALRYLGWSGFVIGARHSGAARFVIDPPRGADLSEPDGLGDGPVCLMISHGHPEHVEGAADFLAQSRPRPADIIASRALCRYLRRRSAQASDRFHPCAPGDRLEVGGGVVDVFAWRHMPHLPPERHFARAHLAGLARRPGLAARIAWASLIGPAWTPMLGFRLTLPGGLRIMNYGEGLHRLLDEDEARRLSARLPADLLLAAIEPEDLTVYARLCRATGAARIAPFEAHGPWRDAFGLGRVDLEKLHQSLEEAGLNVLALSGAAVDISR